MSRSSESDGEFVSDEDEEGKIYQLIYEMTKTDDMEEKEEVQIPSSSGDTPAHLNIEAETHAETHAIDGLEDSSQVKCFTDDNNTKRLDMDVLDDFQRIPVLKTSDKPWRKAGADITDYFNYGFDEESWNAYCQKQTKVCVAKRRLRAKIKVQMGHTGDEEGSCSACSSKIPYSLSARQPSATTDVTGGRPGSSDRAVAHQFLCDEENTSQVATDMSPEEDIFTSYHLSSPIPSRHLLYRYGQPPPSSSAPSDSRYSEGSDDPSASLRPSSSGVYTLIPRDMVSNSGVINTAKAWEWYVWQKKCDKGRERSREHGREEKDSNRGSDRDSREKRRRHRDSVVRWHRRHSYNRSRGEKEEQHGERRHRVNSRDCQKSSCSRNRPDSGESRDRQRRHRKKKGKRSRKDKETSETFSAD